MCVVNEYDDDHVQVGWKVKDDLGVEKCYIISYDVLWHHDESKRVLCSKRFVENADVFGQILHLHFF